MDRFVAFLWDHRGEDLTGQASRWSDILQATSPRWTIVLDRPGLRVLSLKHLDHTNITTQMDEMDGVVIGPLFERGHERGGRLQHLTIQDGARVVATDGDDLIKNYWGNYVAIWRARGNEAVHVLRDPCGAVSCFKMRSGRIDILCSYVADIAGLPALQFSIDWDAIRAFLLHNYFITRFTGLKEISELLPGERMTWRPDSETSFSWAWNAVSLAAEPKRQTFEDARVELQETAEACFTAWGKSYQNIVVRISGGLDSSIVASLMKRVSGAKITGLHFVGQGYEAFELKLARLAAQHAGIDLLELETDSATTNFRSLLEGPKLARPTKQILGSTADALLRGACDGLGAESVMAGHGGDSLFLQRSIAVDAFADYVRLNGPGKDFWRVAYETSMLLERSIWRVLKEAGGFALGRKTWNAFAFLDEAGASSPGILTAEAKASLSPNYMSHDWLVDAQRLPPCKAEQVRGIVALRNYHPARGDGVERDAIHPFISQPIAEFSLRTPTYLFGRGGTDRALERSAFADVVPDAIARRTLKGFVNHRVMSDLAGSIDYLRALVLDGAVVAQAGIDRAQAERLFTPEHLFQGDGLNAVLNLVAAEAWLTPWGEHAPLRPS